MLVTHKTKIALFINIFSYKILILINYHPISKNKMTEKEIQTILDTLGNRVSQLSEDNRLHKLKSDAGKELFFQLKEIINPEDWILLYESCDNTFVKDIMKEWGLHLFPKDYKL